MILTIIFEFVFGHYIAGHTQGKLLNDYNLLKGRGKSDIDAFKAIKNILSNKNHIVHDNFYKCYGKSFIFIRHKHPDEKDFKNAIQWANKVLQNINQEFNDKGV